VALLGVHSALVLALAVEALPPLVATHPFDLVGSVLGSVFSFGLAVHALHRLSSSALVVVPNNLPGAHLARILALAVEALPPLVTTHPFAPIGPVVGRVLHFGPAVPALHCLNFNTSVVVRGLAAFRCAAWLFVAAFAGERS